MLLTYRTSIEYNFGVKSLKNKPFSVQSYLTSIKRNQYRIIIKKEKFPLENVMCGIDT